ncbi:MAG: hypothetical protein AMK73_07970 [Planctomycetes bacterium SM23_32]|nr:MAG: hypothetical protein AMK73_07970 [Planctomycetes bacterium SM23_32]
MILNLTGTWQVRQAESADLQSELDRPGEWTTSTVPGCVHLDLMVAGCIADPFYGMNELDVRWVADADWLYRRSFECPNELAEAGRVELVCQGLDTFATVALNGRTLGRADNMFREWRWDVSGVIRGGRNTIHVLFESARRVGEALMGRHGPLPFWAPEAAYRIYTRKAQYASGWDWSPDLNTCGIWRPLLLEAVSNGRLRDVRTEVDWSDPAAPDVRVAVEIEALKPCAAAVQAELAGPDGVLTASGSCDATPGANVVDLEFQVADPRLWWPAGMGEQHLYELTVRGVLGAEELGPRSLRLGLRRIELRREADDEGEGFVFAVNGEPVFCKGANWVPGDSFLPRLSPEDYDRLVLRAAEANVNMLRVWGGGIYEDDAFMDACDRHGVMVWHDFAFACAPYPDQLDWFCESVRAEAQDNVRRLCHHPSLVLWCGSNENHQFYGKDGTFPGHKLYHEILPAVVAELDGARPYWPGSPFGGESPNSPTHGDQHYWDMWHGWRHPDAQRRYRGRFISEFGMQAPPALETIRDYVPAGGHHTQSRQMEHRQRSHEGTERLYRYLSALFRVPGDFADTVYLMQLMQAEAVKVGVEHWRARKFRTAGALFWQFNDCWPGTSWSCIDYAGRPKALYYYARRFFAPVLPVIDRRDGRFTVTVVNDRLAGFEGELVCGCGSLDGQQYWTERRPVSVPANGVLAAAARDETDLDLEDPADRYFWCRLVKDGREVARNAWLLLPPKHMELTVPGWETEFAQTADDVFAVRVTADTFAKGVRVQLDGLEATFSDNYFDAFAELPTDLVVRAKGGLTPDEVRRRLRIRSVAEVRHAAQE